MTTPAPAPDLVLPPLYYDGVSPEYHPPSPRPGPVSLPTQGVTPGGDPLAAYRPGSTEPWTVAVLCALVQGIQARVVIETGTFEGLTTIALWRALRGQGHFTSLHTVECDPVRFEAASRAIAAAQGNDPSCALNCYQGDALHWLRQFPTGQADLVFLDDDHETNHVAAEACLALRALRPRGLLCLHDVCGPHALGELVRTLGGIVLDLPRLHLSGGLGIIVK